jgi:hypothetical protein
VVLFLVVSLVAVVAKAECTNVSRSLWDLVRDQAMAYSQLEARLCLFIVVFKL